MQRVNCATVRNSLIDYLESELEEAERNRIKNHLKECSDCLAEYTALKEFFNTLRLGDIPDPGEVFWRELPSAVLREVRLRQTFGFNKVQSDGDKNDPFLKGAAADIDQVPLPTSRRESAAAGAQESAEASGKPNAKIAAPSKGCQVTLLKSKWPGIKNSITRIPSRFVLPLAAAVLLSVGISQQFKTVNDEGINTAEFIAKIYADVKNAGLVQNIAAYQPKSQRFGFSEQSRAMNGFTLGAITVGALASVGEANRNSATTYLKQLVDGIKQQAGISTELKRQESRLLALIDELDTEKSVTSELYNRLSDIQQDLFLTIAQYDKRQAVLYNTGSWIGTIELALLARNDDVLRQLIQSDSAVKGLSRINAPAGVLSTVSSMQHITAKEFLSTRDYKSLAKHIDNIKSLLS